MPEPRCVGQDPSLSEAQQIRIGLEQLRLRLLDLTNRNKLLSFRQTRSTLRIVDADLDNLHSEILSGQKLPFIHVPEPTKDEISILGERPPAKHYAEQSGWHTSFDLPTGTGRSSCLPVLHYKEEFDTLVRKISATTKTAIEESGVNLLHLVFGFLEWRESDDSSLIRHAPLLAIPVNLVTPKTREEDRTIKLWYGGDDLSANLSLIEKMRRDFNLEIPTLQDDETPESYFSRFSQILEQKRDWCIRRQISLGLLSFGKLLMYLDLDPGRWPSTAPLDQNARLIEIFATQPASGLQFATEYEIDEEAKKTSIPPIVCDADSSQHSALIDASRGRNLVIEGPPGTGKSQTITNLISMFLGEGRRVLFVAEKMAALEVVKRRLDRYGLGDFCLELHSHKTSKIEVLKSIESRIKSHQSYTEPTTLQQNLGLLASRREDLTKYVNLLNTPYAAIHLSPFELIWNREDVRKHLPENILSPQTVIFQNAPQWDFSTQKEKENIVTGLQAHFRRYCEAGGSIETTANQWSWLPQCDLDHSGQQTLLGTLASYKDACIRQRALCEAFDRMFAEIVAEPTAWIPVSTTWRSQITEPGAGVRPQLFPSVAEREKSAQLEEFLSQRRSYETLLFQLPLKGTGLLDSDLSDQIEQKVKELISDGLPGFTAQTLKHLVEGLKNATQESPSARLTLLKLATSFNVEAHFRPSACRTL